MTLYVVKAYTFLNLNGGVFTAENGKARLFLEKEKDIVELVKLYGGVGYIGSDTFEETDIWDDGDYRRVLNFQPIRRLNARFALLALSANAEKVENKIFYAEKLNVVTSYEATTYRGLQSLGCGIKRLFKVNGSVESKLKLDNMLDVAVEIVDSGDTAKDNDLVIIQDDLVPIYLGKLTRKNMLE